MWRDTSFISPQVDITHRPMSRSHTVTKCKAIKSLALKLHNRVTMNSNLLLSCYIELRTAPAGKTALKESCFWFCVNSVPFLKKFQDTTFSVACLFISNCRRVLPNEHFKMDPVVLHTIRLLQYMKKVRSAIEHFQENMVCLLQ